MPLNPLSVLMYQPADSSVRRLVDIGSALTPPAVSASHGAYEVLRLSPSMRLLTWRREGARFDLSCTGRIQVWAGQKLAASECADDCRTHGVSPLEQDDVAYLEAYLLARDRAWNKSNLPENPTL
ncbi:MAG: hydrogenase [Achromobacter spanius]